MENAKLIESLKIVICGGARLGLEFMSPIELLDPKIASGFCFFKI